MSQTIDISLDEKIVAEIEKRASALKLPISTYITLVLADCLECAEQETTPYSVGEI